MEKLPDIVGFPLEAALEKCRNMGYEVEITVTRPVKVIPEKLPRAVRFDQVSKYRGVVTVVFEE